MIEPLVPLSFPLWGSRLIEASAGTGKTWTIAALYLRLVLGHGNDDQAFGRPLIPSEILVMTFTRAATRELSDRIRSRLVHAARVFRDDEAADPDDSLLQGLLAACPAGAARDQAAWRLAMAAEAMDDAAVFTIDAWVQRMLREHAFDSGSLFDEELQADEAAMLAEAARDYWRQEVYPLGPDAIEGVESVWPTVDKLTADVRNLIRYIGSDAGDSRSLGEVWTEAGSDHEARLQALKEGWIDRALEMRDWIARQVGSRDCPFTKSKLQTRHVDNWLGALELWAVTPDLVECDMKTGRERLTRTGLLAIRVRDEPIAIPAHFDALERLFVDLDRLVPPAHAMRRHAASRIARRVLELKHRASAYGFNDMLVRLDQALAGPSGERLRARIVAQYPVAMIDEFQDTSPLQYRIFDRLYRIADNDRASALLLIGDPKQSIFAFRGADIQSYLRARVATEGRHYLLTTNFRSTDAMVGAVNRMFEAGEKRGGQGAFRFGSEHEANPVPFVPVAAIGRAEVYRNAAGPIAALTLQHEPTLASKSTAQRRFAEHCAEHIAVSLDDPETGFEHPVDGFTRLKPADIAVLVRDRHEAAAMRRALQKRRIASVFLSVSDSVFASVEAADLLHWLRAVADPLDSRRVRVAFATSLIGLSLAELAVLGHDDLAFEARVEQLRDLNLVWRRQGVLPMLRQTLHVMDLPARWLRPNDAADDGERRLTNVLHLAELLQTASARLDGEQAVIRWLADQLACEGDCADEQIVRLESDADLVRIVTVHKAKGLEYPVVYLPFVSAVREPRWDANAIAVIPDEGGERRVVFDVTDEARAAVGLERQREDLRLLYVAVTRARHALWLGVAALTVGNAKACAFHRSAFGYLLAGDKAVKEDEIADLLRETFDGLPSVALVPVPEAVAPTRLAPPADRPDLIAAPDYSARFERDWTIGSFSAFVRDLSRASVPAAAMVDPAVEEELATTSIEAEVAIPSSAPRHRFPRGALPGNFLHDQLEWLAGRRFALAGDADLRRQLLQRCERQGWGHRANDVVAWMTEVVTTPLPPIGMALDAVPRLLPEMEFWFPSEGVASARIDALCRSHLLRGRERPPLPDKTLRGVLMGFADLVFEADGRYWVLDYKSNGLGAHDDDYDSDALEAAMAQHRYDVQAAIYLLALHRLLRQRMGSRYDPARHLGGAIYLFLRGIKGPVAGCHLVAAEPELLHGLDHALAATEESAA